MRTLFTWSLPLVVLLGTASATSPAQLPPPFSDYVQIEGKKNPELLPDWLVWKHVFMTIASARAGNLRGFTHEFEESFTASELLAFYTEVDAQARRDKEYLDEVDATRKQQEEQGVDEKAAARELFAMELGQRQKVLDARDRVLAALSPESQALLERFVDETRSSISSFVPRSELEQFRLPQ